MQQSVSCLCCFVLTAGIYRKIAAAEYTPLPDGFSSGLQDLVRSLLAKETKQRPSISETLNMPYVRQVSKLLKAVTTAKPGRPRNTLPFIGWQAELARQDR